MQISILLAIFQLAACSMGPDFNPPDLNITPPETFLNASQSELMEFQETDNWWQVFDDPDIDQVVKNVIQNNPDIQTAAARVLEVRSVFKQTRADQFPDLNLNAEAGRQSYSSFNPLTGTSGTDISNSYSLSLPASYEIDLWGRLSRATESARAQLLSAEENRRTVVQSLVAEAVSLYLEIESLERQIEITHRRTAAYHQSLEIVTGRYRRGLTSILDVRQASRVLAQGESQLPPLKSALGLKNQALAILQGQYPKNKPVRFHESDYFRLPPEVPQGLPSELVSRRPDICAARAQLHSACALVGVAKAARFPRITLTGNFGYASDELNSLFEPENELWSIAAGSVQPIFNAGKLAAGQRGAEARYLQAQNEYAKTVLQAFAEVEGALLSRKELIERRNLLLKYRKEAAATLDVANDRYGRGLVDYLTILDAQQVNDEAEIQLITVEYEILSNHVSLLRALGGGWDLKMTKGPRKTDAKDT